MIILAAIAVIAISVACVVVRVVFFYPENEANNDKTL